MKFLKWLDRNFEPIMMAVSFFLVCGLIFLQVVLRFAFHRGLAWGEEISRFLFIWSVFLSVPYITKNNKHVAIAVLRDVLPDKVRKVIAILVDLIVVAFSAILLAYSIKNVMLTAKYQDRATAVDISMNWMFVAPVVGYALMTLRGLQTTIWKVMRFNCSFELFSNSGGSYSQSWNNVVATGRNREELKGSNYKEAIAEEEAAFQKRLHARKEKET